MISRTLAALALALLCVACEGPAGPMGPQGPEGPQGPPGEPGPGHTLSYTGQAGANGDGVWRLPPEVGSLDDPPALTCYMSSSQHGPYHVWSTGSTGVTCGLVVTQGELHAVMTGIPPGYWYKFVVVYN